MKKKKFIILDPIIINIISVLVSITINNNIKKIDIISLKIILNKTFWLDK